MASEKRQVPLEGRIFQGLEPLQAVGDAFENICEKEKPTAAEKDKYGVWALFGNPLYLSSFRATKYLKLARKLCVGNLSGGFDILNLSQYYYASNYASNFFATAKMLHNEAAEDWICIEQQYVSPYILKDLIWPTPSLHPSQLKPLSIQCVENLGSETEGSSSKYFTIILFYK